MRRGTVVAANARYANVNPWRINFRSVPLLHYVFGCLRPCRLRRLFRLLAGRAWELCAHPHWCVRCVAGVFCARRNLPLVQGFQNLGCGLPLCRSLSPGHSESGCHRCSNTTSSHRVLQCCTVLAEGFFFSYGVHLMFESRRLWVRLQPTQR